MHNLVMLLWLGSFIAGWRTFWPWLAIPPLIYGVYVTWREVRRRAYYRNVGIPQSGGLVLPSLVLVVWNTFLNAALFGIGAVIAYVI